MNKNELDRAFDETPNVFSKRIDETLRTLKEDAPMKRFTLRTAVIAVLIVLGLCGIAYAIVSMQGQEWYYSNRFTAYQEYEPEKQQAIIENLQTEVPQEYSGDAQKMVAVTVQDYSWAPMQNVFTLSVAARVKDDARYELHPMQDMDADGSYGDELDPDDPEIRTEHWLSTSKGFGPPPDVMEDASKQLLLVDFNDCELLIGDTEATMPVYCYDAFVGEDGACVCVMECDLAQLDEEKIAADYAERMKAEPATAFSENDTVLRPVHEQGGETTEQDAEATANDPEAVKQLQQRLADLEYYNGNIDGFYGDEVTQAVKAFQQSNGLVPDGVAGVVTQTKLFAASADEQESSSQEMLVQERDRQLAYARQTKDAIAQSTDANGVLTLRMNYQVTPFTEGQFGEPATGMAVFKVQTK